MDRQEYFFHKNFLTFNKKFGRLKFRRYKILGYGNPHFDIWISVFSFLGVHSDIALRCSRFHLEKTGRWRGLVFEKARFRKELVDESLYVKVNK